MRRFLSVLISAACGLPFTPVFTLSAMAHQPQMAASGNVGAMIHVDPMDSPPAGRSSQTWFTLTNADGSPILPSTCDCRVMAHDAEGEAIAHHLPLSVDSINGQEAISTMITFPTPGSYMVILSGESKDGSFEPFEFMFPITAVSPLMPLTR
jgi:hypothetical protein